MYLDTILFIIGTVFAVAMIVLAIYLIISRERSRAYADLTGQETEMFNEATASLFNNRSSMTQSSQYQYPSLDGTPGIKTKTEMLAANNETELLIAGDTGGPAKSAQRVIESDGFDPYSLAQFYTVEREIGGGAMSRTFEVKSTKLENRWFMKYIPKKFGRLASEVEILKLLNHASLPRIIDVFHTDEGDYLVETLVEGYSLKDFNKTDVKASRNTIHDWFIQVAQALNYLHSMKPSPIYHLDLKPGNIMITHDDRLVLVDFGIAKRYGEDTITAFTVPYAAPEQFIGRTIEKYAKHINERFGDITRIAGRTGIDARTDIYSLGVIMFELATGELPTIMNMDILKKHVSVELADVIYNCLAVSPNDRYQSTEALLVDLQKVKGVGFKMARLFIARKVAAVMASLSLLISGGTFAGGFIVLSEENASVISAEPEIVTVSLQQSSDFTINKQRTNGTIVIVNSNQVTWQSYDDNVARVDGGRISGINEGETVIRGLHRSKEIDLTVRVIKPVDGLIEVSQQYQAGRFVSLLAGTSERVRRDGFITEAGFISPESITASDDGTVYIVDAGEIRILSNGRVSTLNIPVDYIKAFMVRSFENELYILSEPWQDDERYFYTLARLNSGNVEALYIADARYTMVEDFDFGSDGLLYFIDRNDGMGEIYLKSISLYNVEDITMHTLLPAGSASLTADNNGNVFIGNKELGIIHVYRDNKLEYFAGLEGERAFIDGASPRFYSPQRLEYQDSFLYIWDFNTLRRIEAENGIAGVCITIAGMASPDFSEKAGAARLAAQDTVLPFGALMDFTVTDGKILLTDYKRAVIWEIDK